MAYKSHLLINVTIKENPYGSFLLWDMKTMFQRNLQSSVYASQYPLQNRFENCSCFQVESLLPPGIFCSCSSVWIPTSSSNQHVAASSPCSHFNMYTGNKNLHNSFCADKHIMNTLLCANYAVSDCCSGGRSAQMWHKMFYIYMHTFWQTFQFRAALSTAQCSCISNPVGGFDIFFVPFSIP